ncbi:unnamed protein product [Mytilus coruscus]|uniref:Uncharacterized protein n=1 Tax=Mytilus coruscus TaxID=42192 RepID=A0A6J8BFV0_MYTCO|nr:unnamed protein product [Mytilus coruscus]
MSYFQSFQSSVQDYLTTLPEGLNVTQHTRTTASGHFLIFHFGNDNTDQNNNITGHHPSQQQDIKSDPDQVSTTHNIKQELVDDSTYLATNIKTEPTASYTSSSRLVKQETTSQRHVKPDPEQPAHFHGPASFNSPWRKHWYSSRNRSYRTKRFSQQKENSTTGQQTKETKKSTLQLPRLTPSRTASTDVNVYISRLVSGSYYR